LQVVQVG
jgi:toxin ParE1/3/4